MARFKTRVVNVGHIGIGGNNPIRIQSMTTTDTLNIDLTTEQIIRLADQGCEIARVTVQGLKQALAVEKIKNSLLKKGYKIPLVADIHFFPDAALLVCEFADKVRINPGNYIKENPKVEFLSSLEEGFLPLIEKCQKLKKALRIGVNHGSLSERILNLYGNTSLGMVVSALEYADICQKYNFNDLVFSMKASNPIIMIEAYRLLVKKMTEKNMDYPLHLGVTEAGDEEDGIVKSAIGIGSLLLDGIGDTIRVSLTADPEKEINPAKKLSQLFEFYQKEKSESLPQFLDKKKTFAFLENNTLENLSSHIDGVVNDKKLSAFEKKDIPILDAPCKSSSFILQVNEQDPDFEFINKQRPSFIFLTAKKGRIQKARRLKKSTQNLDIPLIALFEYAGSYQDITIKASAEIGSLLLDNVIDGFCIKAKLSVKEKQDLTLSILQACRKKFVKTEFISCPGCGRTLYNLQETMKSVKNKTSHLPGLKIAIMGCIVNGPGEMADADFGVVGSAPGKVDLFLGKNCIEKNIDCSKAPDKLIELLKKEGKWVEKAN